MSVKLKNEKILIRNAREDDVQILCKWWNDGAVMAHAGFTKGLNTTVEKIKKQIAADSDETIRRLMIIYDNSPIGEMNYRNMGNKTADIGIKICVSDYQEKGLGTKILKMFINSLFNDFGYEEINLDTSLDNKRAQHVYEKIGFKKVDIKENAFKNDLGEYMSVIYYKLMKKDFKM